MILVDSNLLMYAAGAEHPHKVPSVTFLDRVARGEVEAALDAEVLQEVLHRYRALRRWREGRRIFDLARGLFITVLPISVHVLDVARELLDRHDRLMARDAVHAAVVLHYSLEGICSFDSDFDRIEGVRRVDPGKG